MAIELRILGGARKGYIGSYEKSVIAIGRHPMSDLRFDPKRDLDVSARHGEIRAVDGHWTIYDSQSTNGTYVNGQRVAPGGSRDLHDSDVISFGAHGPTVLVHLGGSQSTRINPSVTPDLTPSSSELSASMEATLSGRRPTTERVAIAVREQTRWWRIAVVGAVVVLGGLAAAIYFKSSRTTAALAARDKEISSLITANAQMTSEFKTRLRGDTVLANSLQRLNDSLTRAVRVAGNAQQAARAQQELRKSTELQQKFSASDFPAVYEANDPAIVLISTEIADQPGVEATGFSVSSSGLIVTNRHVVVDSGVRASKIRVKFANTRNWYVAHAVRLADDAAVDLALLQVEGTGPFPTLKQKVASSVDTPVGAAISTIGFPLGTDLPMEGSGRNASAKTTMTMGTVSKSIPDLLQIDAYASFGSSGSPVFDTHGHVIGVVYAGPRDGSGRIVFAVPADRIAQLIKGAK